MLCIIKLETHFAGMLNFREKAMYLGCIITFSICIKIHIYTIIMVESCANWTTMLLKKQTREKFKRFRT